jgi:hypothetical protein
VGLCSSSISCSGNLHHRTEIIMARCIFDNLTLKQAQTLAKWFEGQGEQQASEWFDINHVKSPYVDVSNNLGWCHREGDDIIVQCK